MPAVRFNIPFQSAQQGPTCWYYAIKIIMKFHGIITHGGVGGGALDPQWRSLHRLRQVITDVHREGFAETPDILRNRLHGRYVLEGRNPQVKQALQNMRQVGSTQRFALLRAFLGNGFVQQVTVNPWSAEGVRLALERHGPFYISVNPSPHGYTRRGPLRDPMGDRIREVIPIYNRDFTGGPHAMVVTGASRNGQIFLSNPNYPNTIGMVDWNVLNGRLNAPPPFHGTTIGIAIDCQGLGGGLVHAACVHVVNNARRLP